jgi:lipid A 3-O-deacylase
MLVILAAGGTGRAEAADPVWGASDLVTAHSTLYRPDRWDVRGGAYAHCCFVEKGADLGIEVVTPRLFVIPSLHEFFIPRLHFGGVFNLAGHTSYGYAGLLFTFNLSRHFFLEPFIGVAVTNGVAAGDATHNPIGCTPLLHSGGNLGYRIDQHWSVMLTLEHVSNAGLCNRNVGINSYGAKVGYSF